MKPSSSEDRAESVDRLIDVLGFARGHGLGASSFQIILVISQVHAGRSETVFATTSYIARSLDRTVSSTMRAIEKLARTEGTRPALVRASDIELPGRAIAYELTNEGQEFISALPFAD